MAVATSLIPGLDDLVRHGDPTLRDEAARRIAGLFLEGAAGLKPKHVDLFDDILTGLVPHAELVARAEIAERLSVVANAPKTLIGRLARENEVLVAGPILRRSLALDDETLLEIARLKGQGHLLAMSERPKLAASLTDVIVQRGDREVMRRVAGNAGASFSERGYAALIKRANQDAVLTLSVGQRADLSETALRQLLAGSIGAVRRRLHDVVNPERRQAIRLALADVEGVPERSADKRDFAPAQRAVLALHRAGNLNEAALLGFAKAYRYEESIAALSAMSGVPIPTLDNLVASGRFDPILIVGKTIGLGWATVRALIVLRLGPSRAPAPADIEHARLNFAKLMPSTAERVVGFWKTRQTP